VVAPAAAVVDLLELDRRGLDLLLDEAPDLVAQLDDLGRQAEIDGHRYLLDERDILAGPRREVRARAPQLPRQGPEGEERRQAEGQAAGAPERGPGRAH